MPAKCDDDSVDRRPYMSIKFMGAELKFGGKEVTAMIIALLIGVPIVAGVYLSGEERKREHSQQISETTVLIKRIDTVLEAQDATTYVLSLTNEERQNLQLTKPKRVRDMEMIKDERRRTSER